MTTRRSSREQTGRIICARLDSMPQDNHEATFRTPATRNSVPPKLALVIPCYNEEAVLPETAKVLGQKIGELIGRNLISSASCILFVDDGSSDATWSIIKDLHGKDRTRYRGIEFSHNSGHQNAVYAGLVESLSLDCDASISMDADLQDDPNAIEEMITNFRNGDEIVFGVRNNRNTDTVFKRFTAESFYRLMTWMGTDTIPDHADFRLMGATSIRALSQYKEKNLYLRGIVPALGFESSKVYYTRGSRIAGESKYPFSKMLSFALEGITSFSVKPLRLITLTGFMSILASFVMLIYTIVSVTTGQAVAGWGSMMFSLWLLGGLILTSLGVVGEYVGRIYIETKQRPRYIIENRL